MRVVTWDLQRHLPHTAAVVAMSTRSLPVLILSLCHTMSPAASLKFQVFPLTRADALRCTDLFFPMVKEKTLLTLWLRDSQKLKALLIPDILHTLCKQLTSSKDLVSNYPIRKWSTMPTTHLVHYYINNKLP